MKRKMRRFFSLLLALALLWSACPAALAADTPEVLTACGGKCGHCPTILIPGNFQSPTRLYDASGAVVRDAYGNAIGEPFFYLTKGRTAGHALRIMSALFASVALQTDVGLSGAVSRAVADAMRGNETDNTGKHTSRVEAVRYPHSMAWYSDEEKAEVYRHFILDEYTAIAGEDHLYFFSYDSLGSVCDAADELFDFIQNVKRETGHVQVNLLPVSQGATVMTAMLEKHRDELARDVHRIVLVVPALDGSMLLSKIFLNGINQQDTFLYRDALPYSFLLGDTATAYILNLALRLLPRDTLCRVLDRTVDAVRETVVVNCTCMWALTAECDYDALYAQYLTDGTREPVREEVEFYHRARSNVWENLDVLRQRGVEVFDIAEYDEPFMPFFDGWDAQNADGLIHVPSTSGGAVCCNIGQTLPADYTQQGTYCTCGGDHISPDRRVDASAGRLCETTFYFRGGKHMTSAWNDVLIRLAIRMLTDDSFTDVHSDPAHFPQFNRARAGYSLRSNMAYVRRKVDYSTLSAEDAQALDEALRECEAVLEQTVVDVEAFERAYDHLDAIALKTGLIHRSVTTRQKRQAAFWHAVSDRCYELLGGRGFSDVLRRRYRK